MNFLFNFNIIKYFWQILPMKYEKSFEQHTQAYRMKKCRKRSILLQTVRTWDKFLFTLIHEAWLLLHIFLFHLFVYFPVIGVLPEIQFQLNNFSFPYLHWEPRASEKRSLHVLRVRIALFAFFYVFTCAFQWDLSGLDFINFEFI